MNDNDQGVTIDVNSADRTTVAVTAWESQATIRTGYTRAVSPSRAREIAAELLVAADQAETSKLAMKGER